MGGFMPALVLAFIAATIAGLLALVGGIYTLVVGCAEITFEWSRVGGRMGILGLVCLDGPPAQSWLTTFDGTVGGVGLIIVGTLLLLPAIGFVVYAILDAPSGTRDAPDKKSTQRAFPTTTGLVPQSVQNNKVAMAILKHYWRRIDGVYWQLPAHLRMEPSPEVNQDGTPNQYSIDWWAGARKWHNDIWVDIKTKHGWAPSKFQLSLSRWSDNNWQHTEASARALYCHRYGVSATKADRLSQMNQGATTTGFQ